MILYHGSNNKFNYFSLKKSGSNFNKLELGYGIYFTKKLSYTKIYGKYIYAAEINLIKIKNIKDLVEYPNKFEFLSTLYIDNKIIKRRLQNISELTYKQLYDSIVEIYKQTNDLLTSQKKASEMFIKHNIDGLYDNNIYCVFNIEIIKDVYEIF